MAFAPHANAPGLPVVLGFFRECDHNHTFEFAERDGFPDDFHPELPHMVYVGPDETRLALVRKTVVDLLNGDGMMERWMIKDYRIYHK